MIRLIAILLLLLAPLMVPEKAHAQFPSLVSLTNWVAYNRTISANADITLGGDSTMSGFHTTEALGYWPITESSPQGPTGNNNANIAYWLNKLCGVWATNFARAGAKWDNWLAFSEPAIGSGWDYVVGDSDTASHVPQIHIMRIGVNDFTVPSTFASILPAMDWWRRSCYSNNILPVLLNSFPGTVYNVEYEEWCRTNYAIWRDQSALTIEKIDGTHPSTNGYFVIASNLVVLLAELAEIIPEYKRTPHWYNAGVLGGIPNYTTVYTNLYGIDRTGATDVSGGIQTAINNCPDGQKVYLPPGTFNIQATLNMKTGVELGGSVTNEAGLIVRENGSYTNTVIYGSVILSQMVLMSGGGGQQGIGILSGATNTSTNFTTTNIPPCCIGAGGMVTITQTNRSPHVHDSGWESGSSSGQCSYCNVYGDTAWVNYSQGQRVEILTVVNGTNFTFRPALRADLSTNGPRMLYFSSSGAGLGDNHIARAGVSYIKFSRADAPATPSQMVQIASAADCWVTRCQFHRGGDRGGVYTTRANRITVSKNYFKESYGDTAGEGLISFPDTHDFLYEDNWFNGVNLPISLSGPHSGGVVAYNYSTNAPNANTNVMVTTFSTHGAHVNHVLFEGNVTQRAHFDFIHGTASHITFFRNAVFGRQPNRGAVVADSAMGSLWLDKSNNFYNVVGNVWGYSGVGSDIFASTNQVFSPTVEADGDAFNNTLSGGKGVVWWERYGYSGFNTNLGPPIEVTNTMTYAGNFSYGTGTTNWTNWATPQATRIIRASWYLTNKPSWFGALEWPPIGPGTNVGSLAFGAEIPAGYRFAFNDDPPETSSKNKTKVAGKAGGVLPLVRTRGKVVTR